MTLGWGSDVKSPYTLHFAKVMNHEMQRGCRSRDVADLDSEIGYIQFIE